ncbi:hypothetical protein MWU59_14090 [Flavobacteriaceae bacterium F08102]|nr:hypothetical protein [Flavobacteriaceae bacterium F08102]
MLLFKAPYFLVRLNSILENDNTLIDGVCGFSVHFSLALGISEAYLKS